MESSLFSTSYSPYRPSKSLTASFSPSKSSLSPDHTSNQVMRRVFDEEFSIGSSAKKKINNLSPQKVVSKEKEMETKMNTMAENLLKMNLFDAASGTDATTTKLSVHETREIINDDDIDLDVFSTSYQNFGEIILNFSEYKNAENEEKIKIILNFFTDQNSELSIGSGLFIWEILYKFKEEISQMEIELVLNRVFEILVQTYEQKHYYLLIILLEIIALAGPNEISFQNIKFIAALLKESSLEVIQSGAYVALMNLDFPGFYALCFILNREFNTTPNFILNKLANTEIILIELIIPSLINDIASSQDIKKKISALNALNRMFHLISSSGIIPILTTHLKEGLLDRQLICSCLKGAGEEGEKTLLKIIKNTNNNKIKLAILSVLPWRTENANIIKILVEEFLVGEHYKQNPGTMCIYKGSLVPCSFVERNEEDLICINSRDFIAALQRLSTIKQERFQQLIYQKDNLKNMEAFNIKKNGLFKEMLLVKFFDPQSLEKSSSNIISEETIKALVFCLNDENAQVREESANTLGIIGKPEAEMAVEYLNKCFGDIESGVRCAAAWAVGNIANYSSKCNKLLDLLKDNYYKVRNAACIAIGNMGPNMAEISFPLLFKCLRDGSINKLTICETIIKLGPTGEHLLIEALKNAHPSNFKLKSSIIQSFSLANVDRPSIDFVIEEIFRNSNDPNHNVRKACLISLDHLRMKSQNSQITYLKSKNILPLFYHFLQDPSVEIREMSILAIQCFGPQAELLFIEGLTKDSNPIIRSECAKGLAIMGPQNFRVLLFGLRDLEEIVRIATLNSILKNFDVDTIIEEFSHKMSSIPALILALREIIEGCEEKLKGFMRSVKERLENVIEGEKNDFYK